jgi:hypothetical protein
MPQPFLIASFRVFPSQRSRASLEAAGFLVVIHRRATCAPLAVFHLRFPRRPRRKAQWPGSPEGYELPFHEPRLASRSLWTSNDGAAMPRQLHPLRSVDPPASPFATTRANPSRRSILSWISSPSESLPEPRSLEPAQLRGAGHTPSPEGFDVRRRGQQPPTPGETFPTQQATPSQPLAATRSLPTGLHRLSAASPSPLTFDALEQARSRVAFGASKCPRSDATPRSNVSLS